MSSAPGDTQRTRGNCKSNVNTGNILAQKRHYEAICLAMIQTITNRTTVVGDTKIHGVQYRQL